MQFMTVASIREAARDLAVLYPDGAELNDPVFLRRKPCGLKVKDHIFVRVKSIGELIFLPDLYAFLKIIDKVAFYAVDDLEEFLGIYGRKSLFLSLLILR